MRTASFGAGAAQAFAAKGLYADHGVDLVTIHIHIVYMYGSGYYVIYS